MENTALNRRDVLKLGLAAGGAMLMSPSKVQAEPGPVQLPTGGVFNPPSPLARPFLQELPRMPVKCSLPNGADDLLLPENGGVAPNGTVHPQITGNDVFTTYDETNERIVATQQLNSGNTPQFAPKRYYVLKAREATHAFHPDPPYNCSIIWGYDGLYPGPTFVSRYGVPILVRIFNRLYFDEQGNPIQQPNPGGFGDRRISTHLHNGHTGSESDGNPEDIYPLPQLHVSSPNKYPESIVGIDFRDHHYALFRAGLDPSRPAALPAPNINDGDPRETVSTLWYHDHSMDHTAENVYKGLVGFHLLFDEFDSGDENDQNPNALRLPSHEFDVPLLIQDKRFDANGQLFLGPPNNLPKDGFLGDRFVVNGAIQPKLTVLRRRYRFRILNAGPSRFYKLFLVKNGVDQEFQIIGNDESLLESPLTSTDESGTSSVLISVAERAEVVIDFSQFATGDQLFLVNRLVMKPSGRGPEETFDGGKFIYKTLKPEEGGDQILRFDVAGDAPNSRPVPATLRLNPDLPKYLTDILNLDDPDTDLKRVRDDLRKLPNHFEFRFNKKRGLWNINEELYKAFRKDWCAQQGGAPGAPDGEVWTLINKDAGWAHPIHIHLEEFRILLRSTVVPPDEPTSIERPLPFEQCKKDVVLLGSNEEVQIFLRFRDFLGKYPIHCHNVVHEDHAMMARFDVVPERTADCPPVPPTP